MKAYPTQCRSFQTPFAVVHDLPGGVWDKPETRLKRSLGPLRTAPTNTRKLLILGSAECEIGLFSASKCSLPNGLVLLDLLLMALPAI